MDNETGLSFDKITTDDATAKNIYKKNFILTNKQSLNPTSINISIGELGEHIRNSPLAQLMNQDGSINNSNSLNES